MGYRLYAVFVFYVISKLLPALMSTLNSNSFVFVCLVVIVVWFQGSNHEALLLAQYNQIPLVLLVQDLLRLLWQITYSTAEILAWYDGVISRMIKPFFVYVLYVTVCECEWVFFLAWTTSHVRNKEV